MKTRWFLVVMALIGTTLACNLIPELRNYNPTFTEVKSVAVNPPSGIGSFMLEVTYFAFTDGDRLPEPITCYYVTPFGAMMPIGSVTPPGGIIGRSGTTLTGTLAFSVSAPGVYTATCENDSRTSKASAVFDVTNKISDSGTRIRYIYNVSNVPGFENKVGQCAATQEVTLTIMPDGSAELEVVGPDFFNSIWENCTQTESLYGTLISGTANAVDGTVSFTSCGGDGSAQGSADYADGVLTGEVACFNTQGEYFGKPALMVTMP